MIDKKEIIKRIKETQKLLQTKGHRKLIYWNNKPISKLNEEELIDCLEFLMMRL